MASPFEIFRKNQRLWMAGAVFIAVVAFVIAPMLEMRGGDQGPNPVVASWNGGSLRFAQLQRDQNDLGLVNRFLRELASKVIAKGGMPGVPGFSPDLSTVGVSPSTNPGFIVERHLLNTEAQRLGIRFDDSAVTLFLQRFVDGRMSGKDIQELMVKSTDRRLTMPLFSRVLREELTYQELRRLTSSSLAFADIRDSRTVGYPILTTPSKNWREYLKTARRAKIQAYPVNVRDQLESVTSTPSDTELRRLYDEGKQIVRHEGMPDTQPAFMKPATANIEFASIEVEKLVAAEIAKLSEETLRNAYETRVLQNEFRVPIETKPEEAAPAEGKEEAAAPAETAPAETTDAEAADKKSEDENKPSEGEKNPPQPETPKPETPQPETPQPETPQPETPQPESPAPDSQSKLVPEDRSVRLVSYQDEETKPADAPETKEETPPAEPKETDRPSQEPPAENPPAENPPAETPAPETPATDAPSATLSLGDALPPLPPDIPLPPPPAPMRTQTFDEVKDQIARDLALEAAVKIADERIENVYSAMRIYQSELLTYESLTKQPGAPKTEEPTKPNIADLAKEFELDYGTTGTVDALSIQLAPIGRSILNLRNVEMGQEPTGTPAIVDNVRGLGERFTPLTATDQIGGEIVFYVFWKTELEQPQTPSFESVKEEVLAVWKLQEAQKLAETKARDIASKVGSGKLEDVLTTDEEKKFVVEPAPFTAINQMYLMLLRFNGGRGEREVNSIDSLQPVDMSFMDTVFNAQPGEAVVAPDERRSVYYVVKVLETSPSTDELLATFQRSPKESVGTLVTRENSGSIESYRASIFERLQFRQYHIPGLE